MAAGNVPASEFSGGPGHLGQQPKPAAAATPAENLRAVYLTGEYNPEASDDGGRAFRGEGPPA